MKERWKVVPIAKDYEVSNLGRVRRRTKKGPNTHPGKILKARKTNRNGKKVRADHLSLGIYPSGKAGGQKSFGVHTLVLLAFRGKPKKGLECRHLDGNGFNNILKNLKWGTKTQNMKDQIRHGVYVSNLKGKDHRAMALKAWQTKYRRYSYKNRS